jgi:hypothetical protein
MTRSSKRFKSRKSEAQPSEAPKPARVAITPESLELDMPPYSKVTHEAWLKLLLLRCKSDCPDYCFVIKGIVPDKPIKPVLPTAEQARSRAVLKSYEIKLKRYLDVKDALKKEKKKLCAHLWRCTSDPTREYTSSVDPLAESKHKIKTLLRLVQKAYFSAEHTTPAAQKTVC